MQGGYLVLWIFGLATALSWVSFLWSGGSERPEGGRGLLLRLLGTLAPLVGCLLLVWGCLTLRLSGARPDWLLYVASWGLTYLLLSPGIVILGRRSLLPARWKCGANAFLSLLLFVGCYTVIVIHRTWDLIEIRDSADAFIQEHTSERPPVEENAASVYRQVIQSLQDLEEWPDWARNSPPEAWAKTDPAEIHAFLAMNRQAIETAREVVARPSFFVNREYFSLMGLFTKEEGEELVYQMAALGRLLALDALAVGSSGDLERAFRSLSVLQSVADHLSQIPFGFTDAIAASLLAMEAECLELLLSAAGSSSIPASCLERRHVPLLERLPRRLQIQKADYVRFLVSVYLGRHIVKSLDEAPVFGGKDGRQKLRRVGVETWTVTRFWLQFYRAFLLKADLRAIDNHFDEYLVQARKPHLEERCEIDAERLRELGAGPACAPMLSSYHRVLPMTAASDALQGLCRIAVAAEAYRAAEGRYPADLVSLVPEYIDAVPTDPFGGEPLRAATFADGLILYSAGIGKLEEEEDPDWLEVARSNPRLLFVLGQDAWNRIRSGK